MIAIAPFAATDVIGLELQPWQRIDAPVLDLEFGETLAAAGGSAWTARDGGRVLGCGGVAAIHPHHGLAWVLMSQDIGRAMTAVTRTARAAILEGPWSRVEAIVRADWPCAARWAAMLGLEQRCLMRNWGPLAHDHFLFDWAR